MKMESNISMEKNNNTKETMISSFSKNDENKYISSLNEKELKAYDIAKKYLGTSFDLKKSNGFLRWKKEN